MHRDANVREQMFSLITSWQQSELSQKAFCELNGIRYHVFHYWYKRFREVQLQPTPVAFIPLKVQPLPSANTACAPVELLLADGKRLLFHQPVSSDYLKALIS